MLQLGQITPAIYSNLHTTMINNMFVSDETVLGLYQFLQLSVFFSSFTKVVIQLGGKNLARHFFPLPLESERKVVKPGASSYLAFQTLRWTWSRRMNQKRYIDDLEPCSGYSVQGARRKLLSSARKTDGMRGISEGMICSIRWSLTITERISLHQGDIKESGGVEILWWKVNKGQHVEKNTCQRQCKRRGKVHFI